jgi:lipid-A-disaccharide synthase
MGVGAPWGVLHDAWRLRRAVLEAAREVRPHAAVLYNYSEFNSALLAPLRDLGVRTLFYSPPQVWAWRPGRARRIARTATFLATVLPFEAAMWRALGGNASYVGHPALHRDATTSSNAHPGTDGDGDVLARDEDRPPRIVLLPGSRPREVSRMLATLLEGARRAQATRAIRFRLVMATALPSDIQERTARECAATLGPTCEVVKLHPNEPLGHALAGADLALSASGTATLEAAFAGVPPIIVHRVGRVEAAIAARLMTTPWVGLPNILLGAPVFPELLQEAATPRAVAHELLSALDRERYAALRRYCAQVRARMGHAQPTDAVLRTLRAWREERRA